MAGNRIVTPADWSRLVAGFRRGFRWPYSSPVYPKRTVTDQSTGIATQVDGLAIEEASNIAQTRLTYPA